MGMLVLVSCRLLYCSCLPLCVCVFDRRVPSTRWSSFNDSPKARNPSALKISTYRDDEDHKLEYVVVVPMVRTVIGARDMGIRRYFQEGNGSTSSRERRGFDEGDKE